MMMQEQISLKDHTTFKIGGPARYFVSVKNVDDLVGALAFAKDQDVPYYVLAGGSNTLVSDAGYNGVVLHMALDSISVDDASIEIGSGAMLMDLLLVAAAHELAGLEGLAGVPGSVGGAVRGNAGAFGTEIADWLARVRVYDTLEEREEVLERSICQFGYRHSVFKEHPGRYIILSATFDLEMGDRRVIEDKMHDIIVARNKKHIQNIQSAGSFFVNPEVDERVQRAFQEDKEVASKNGRVPAGWLLERAGLSQKRVGDIQAGEMHANYFINVGDGTAEEVMQLASLAKTRVRDMFDVQLHEEVTLVGFDQPVNHSP